MYLPLAHGLTLAVRGLGERVTGDMPIAMLPEIASSFRDFGGVGGSKSLRGVPGTRFLGNTRLLSSVELRWRTEHFQLFGQRWRWGLVGFIDAGRVWLRDEEDGGSLHFGRGGGMRWTWDENFIVSVDLARGSETDLAVYVGLGHQF